MASVVAAPIRNRRTIAVAGLVVSAVPSVLAGSGLLPGASETCDLLFALAPIGLGYALRHGPGASTGAGAEMANATVPTP